MRTVGPLAAAILLTCAAGSTGAATAPVGATPVDLGTLGGTQSRATAVSPSGQTVGFSHTAGDAESHAFSWTRTGGMVDLGTLGGTRSSALAVSAAGQVVGESLIPSDIQFHAFS